MEIEGCPDHGSLGYAVVCQHVANAIHYLSYGCYHWIGVRASFIEPMLVCEDCLSTYRLERFTLENIRDICNFNQEEPPEYIEDFLNAYKLILGSTTVCSECLAVAQVTQARKEGKDEPFPIYGKTITTNHRELLQDLKTLLLGQIPIPMSIQPSIAPSFSQPALFLNPGAYTRPLEIVIYYILNERDQQKLLTVIDEFFQYQHLNQVVIKFYEAEVWEISFNPENQVRSWKRGEEKLLKEVFLNC
jgi:hypothetical protein